MNNLDLNLINLLKKGTINTVKDYNLFLENYNKREKDGDITDIRIYLNTEGSIFAEIYEIEENDEELTDEQIKQDIRFYLENVGQVNSYKEITEYLLENFENDGEEKKDEIFEKSFEAILSSINNYSVEYNVYVDINLNNFKIEKIWIGEETSYTNYLGYNKEYVDYFFIYAAKGSNFEDDLSQYPELEDEENLKGYYEDWLYEIIDEKLEEIKKQLKDEYIQ